MSLRQQPNIVPKELAHDGEVDEHRGKHNTIRKTHPGIGLKEMKEGYRCSSWGVMEGFLEEVLATARPGNQEDTGLAMSMCGCRARQRGSG